MMVDQVWTPPTPYELVEATEHHGPYICTSYGTTVCDFYAMSDPSSVSVRNGGTSRPISFTDAAEHAEFMVRAANAYGDMLAALRGAIEWMSCVEGHLRMSGPFKRNLESYRAILAAAESSQ